MCRPQRFLLPLALWLAACLVAALSAVGKPRSAPDEDRERGTATGRPLAYHPGRTLDAPFGRRIEATGAYAREYWYWYQRSLPGGVFPRNAEFDLHRRATAFRTHAAQRWARSGALSARLQAGQWQELGPRGVQQFYGPGIVSGRVMAVLPQPASGRILVGTASGGIWKRSTALGAQFEPKSDSAANLSVGCLVADPSHPDLIYAGTGEPGVSIDAFSGAGILKSTDGGESWVRVDNGIFTSAKISRIWVDPRSSEHLLATALFQGLFESNDGGITWSQLLAAGGMGFAVSPSDPKRILVSDTTPYGGTGGDLQLSTDGGRTFQPVHGPWQGSGVVVGRIDLAFAPSASNVIWAAVAPPTAGSDGGRSGVYRSTDGGKSFVSIFPSNDAGTDWYTNALAVSPTDPDQIFVGGIDLYRGRAGGRVSQVSNFFAQNHLAFMHGDQHAVLFDPLHPQTMYAANDGGIYVSANSGKSWSDLNAGLGTIQFYAGAAAATGGLAAVLGGTQDNGTLLPASGLEWTQVNGGDGFQCAYDPQRSNVAYASYLGSTYYLSTDSGRTFRNLPALPFLENEHKPFRSPLTIDPSNGSRIYVGAERVYRGDSDRTSSVIWTALGPGPLFPNDTIFRIAVAPSDGTVVYASGGPHLARHDGSGGWTSIDPPGGQFITGIAIDPADANDILCARSGFTGHQVARSRDGGATWADLTADLPNTPANNVVIRPAGGRLDAYLATDTGVYYADLNAGALTWTPVGFGLPNVVVEDVLLAGGGSRIVAVTHGRGMWLLDAAAIQLSQPNGGEAWGIGSLREVAWSSTGLPGNVRIDLSRDSGQSWETILPQVGNTGSASWTASGPATDRARVRVVWIADPSYLSESGSDFSIVSGSTVNGRVTSGGAGLGGVRILAQGTWAETASDGSYSLPGVFGSVNVIPTRIGYQFDPPSTSLTIAGDQQGIDFQASLSPALQSLSLTAPSVRGGKPLTGSLTLTSAGTAPVVVHLESDDPSVVTPLNGLRVAKRKTSLAFRLTTRKVGVVTPVTLTGSLGGSTITAKVLVTP